MTPRAGNRGCEITRGQLGAGPSRSPPTDSLLTAPTGSPAMVARAVCCPGVSGIEPCTVPAPGQAVSARGAAFPSRFVSRVTPYFPGGPGVLVRVVGALIPLGLGQRGKRGRSGLVLTCQVSGSVGSIIPVLFWTKESSAPLPGGRGQTGLSLCYSPASRDRTPFFPPATAPLSP